MSHETVSEGPDFDFDPDRTDCKKCGRQNCPDMRRRPDGGMTIGEHVDALEALEEPRVGINLTPEQASDLRAWLVKHGF
jgi:hypothetical protein